jgi:hypothetical protein
MSVEIDIKWNTEEFENKAFEAGMTGLKKISEVILGEAKKIVPLDTGTLMRSGTVEAKPEDKSVITSFNTPYALKQHEAHKSKSKYLERPFLELKDKAQDFVNRELNKL